MKLKSYQIFLCFTVILVACYASSMGIDYKGYEGGFVAGVFYAYFLTWFIE